MAFVGLYLLLTDCLLQIGLYHFCSIVKVGFSALLSNLDNASNLYVKHIFHSQVFLFGGLFFFNSTHWSLDSPLFLWIKLRLLLLDFLCCLSPHHLFLPKIMIFLLSFPLVFFFLIVLTMELFNLLFKLILLFKS